ncbi:MAG: hypothetical protein NUV52_03480 [Candidatus Roizmanbacteria bacterium]|nr:hypothetical protein [Candidatus Roizmanbacteria bacterium]
MIKLLREGGYCLIETKNQTKILTLDRKKTFAWVPVADRGELLVTSHKKHQIDHVLCTGRYRLYDVQDEPTLTDLVHLELLVGEGKWQGYLLLTGLPTNVNNKNRIVPTNEIITKATY